MSSRTDEKPPRRAPTWSLARWLITWYACSAFALVFAATTILHWGLIREFEEGDDELLHERIQVLRGLLRNGKDSRTELAWEVEHERKGFESPQIYLRVLDEYGSLFLETPGMAQLLPAEVFPVAVGPGKLGEGVRVRSPSGGVFRAMTAEARAGPSPSERMIIQAAFDFAGEAAVVRKYRYLLAIVLGGSALISLGLAYRITRRSMRPLEEIVETTRRVQSSKLGERVQSAGLPAELASLADNFNSMLDRLEESFVRLSRFSSDIAHELRTPINNLRGEAEVALSKPRSADEYREVLTSSLEEFEDLSRIIDGLLFIARAEKVDAPIHRERINVATEFRSIVEFYAPAAEEKDIALGVEAAGELFMDADRLLFRRAVGNLVANALACTPTGGTIRLSARLHESAVHVEVRDTGIGIAPEHLPHIFDRFYRVQRARNQSPAGAGLGLSIVKTIMDLHRGSAEIESQRGHGTKVTLKFPQITET